MINDLEKFVSQLEMALNERDKKIKKRDELIHDVNDLCNLFPELEQVIDDLEKKYAETQDRNVKLELDSYLKEREVYFDTIQSFRLQAGEISQELKNNSILECEEQFIFDFYKRHELSLKLAQFRDQRTQEEEILYQQYSKELELLDASLRDKYVTLSEEKIDDFVLEEEEIDTPSIMSSFEASKKSELEEKKKTILQELHHIEMEKEHKCYLKFSYQGVRKNVSIPKRLKGKYCRLLTSLRSIDRELERFIPKVDFDSHLYQTMTVDQQRVYLANIMLQIEARSSMSFNKAYVNNKYIPYEYKNMYENVLHLLNEQNAKKVTYYNFSIDRKKLDSMSLIDKLNYFDDLCRKITSLPITTNQVAEVKVNHKVYKINENDRQCFETAYQEYLKVREQIENEIQITEKKQKVILNNSRNNIHAENVFVNGKDVLVLPEQLESFVQNTAYIKSAQASIFKDITFDMNYYNTLFIEDRIVYCNSIIQEIRNQKIVVPVEVLFEDKSIFIESSYKKTFVKVNALLTTLHRTNSQKSSIQIDEEYVKTLSDSDKELYYVSIIQDICKQSIARPFETTIGTQTYQFDENYKGLFFEVISRLQELSYKKAEPLKVESVRKSSKIKKLVGKLNKKFVYAMIGTATLLLSFTALIDILKTSKYQHSSVSEVTESLDDSIVISNSEKDIPESILTDSVDEMTPNWNNEVTSFRLAHDNETTSIFGGDYSKPLTPLYPNDDYRVVARNYVMPDGSIEHVSLEDENALAKISQIESAGGVLQTVSAVAKTGEEDYAKNHIPTGNFVIDNHLVPNNELDQEITDYLNQGRGR